MTEITTMVRVRVTVPELDPRDPKDLAEAIEDHLWATFNDNGSLVNVEYVPASGPLRRLLGVADTIVALHGAEPGAVSGATVAEAIDRLDAAVAAVREEKL